MKSATKGARPTRRQPVPKATDPTPKPAKPEPDAREAKAIEGALGNMLGRTPRVRIKAEKREGKPVAVSSPHDNTGGWFARLADAFGTSSPEFADAQLGYLMNVILPRPGHPPEEKDTNALLAAVDGARPRNEVEAMLATQMAATHALAMNFMGRACRAQQVPQFESTANQAAKMLRTFAVQVEALARLRRGGEQKVTVEHVHVYPGGQAIVGAVTHAGPAPEGGRLESERQSHATGPLALAHAPDGAALSLGSPALRSPDPERDAVSVAGSEGQEKVSDARRRKEDWRPGG